MTDRYRAELDPPAAAVARVQEWLCLLLRGSAWYFFTRSLK